MVKALLILFKGQEASHLTSQAGFTKPRQFSSARYILLAELQKNHAL